MEKSKLENTIIMVLISLVLGFLIVSVSLMLKPTSVGIVVDRIKLSDGTRELVYGTFNLSVIKGFVITSIVLAALNIVGYLLIFYFKIKEKEKIVKSLLISEVIILILLIAFNIFMLSIYPVSFDKYNNFTWALSLANLILVLSVLVYSIYLLVSKRELESKNKWTVQILSEGAILVAVSVILSVLSDMIPFLKLPNGGSFSLSMLPIFIFALRRGAKAGGVVGLTYAIINFLIDGMIIHWGSIFFDYLIPYTLLGIVSGLFMKKANQGKISFSIIAVLIGGFLRYLSHSVSGVIFFSMYVPEGLTAFYYSFILYNLPYMAVSTTGALIFVLLLHKRLITQESRVV